VKGNILDDGVRGTVELVSEAGRKRLFENGDLVRRARDLQERLQVRVIAENSQRLLEGEPALRRLFLDWNLFHVEQRYAELHSSFRRMLAQRNAWLRKGAPGPRVWDDGYIDLAERITTLRETYTRKLSFELDKLGQMYPTFPLVRTFLDRGWPAEKGLGDALSTSFRQDLQRGYTRFGPARADVCISVNGAAGIGSRGQVKVAVCLLQYAAENIDQERRKGACVWLLDDLRAELDASAAAALWEAFLNKDEQIFTTGRDAEAARAATGASRRSRVFLVEQGAIWR